MTFGEKLQALRKGRGLSQEALAEQLNVTRQAISKWESGAIADVDNLVRLSRFFGCSIDYLIKDEITEPVSPAPTHQKKNKATAVAWSCAAGSVSVLLILYIVSRFIRTPIGILNHETGMVWWNGFEAYTFYGLVMKYNLESILYACLAAWVISIGYLTFYPLMQGPKFPLNRFTVYRIAAFIWTMLATYVWFYLSTRMYQLAWDKEIVVIALIYLLVLFILLRKMRKSRT